MRNQYGIWNQQRWLRSIRTEMFEDKPTPAPLQRQPYYDRMRQLASHANDYYGGRRPEFKSGKKADRKKKAKEEVLSSAEKVAKAKRDAESGTELAPPSKNDLKEGADIRWIKDISPPEHYYDKSSYTEWMAVVENDEDFLSVVPKDDPYRLERDLNVYASGDLRWMNVMASKPIIVRKDKRIWMMGADIGVRLRPVASNKLSAVVEARFLGSPSEEDPEDGFAQGAIAKSAYLLADDLAYNSFVQAGLYRPMFGHYDPDHNALASEVSGLTQRAVFNAVGVGTAPNVPFLILNYLRPTRPDGDEFEASKGLTATLGARFVTYGASLAASYWDSKWLSAAGIGATRNMYALTGGMQLKKFTLNFEFLKAELSTSAGAKNAGSVATVHMKFRTWNEVYFLTNFASSNVARNLAEGSGSETAFGMKAFLMSNFELEMLYVMRKLDELGVDNSHNLTQIQAHVFF